MNVADARPRGKGLEVNRRGAIATWFVVVSAFGVAPAGSGSSPVPLFGAAVRVAAASGMASIGLPRGTEPRVAVAPNGRRYVITNDATGNPVVFGSSDGASWTAPGAFPKPRSPSPDVDIVATRTGRLVAAELDGFDFSTRVSYSDDGGRTWRASRLAALADQDRPWLAVGPDDPSTHRPRVYLLFHNLFSAFAAQNMFLSTSTDGGATFGVPVPVALPPSQAFLDLQCGDASGPSGVAVNRTTGRVYVVWATRTSKAGGCGAQVLPGPVEFSIESPTRVWAATSPDARAGSWRTSLVVDDSATGNVVAVLWSPIAVDRSGNVYIAYPETPRAYPDYEGAAIRYRWSRPDLSRWSRPVTVAPAGGRGNLLAHIVAGGTGRLDFAYLSGIERPGAPAGWFATVAQTLDALAVAPHVVRVGLSPFPSYSGTAEDIAGACKTGPTGGIRQGLLCPRAADNFGVAIDRACRLLVAWPAIETDRDAGRLGTWVSVQQSGPALC